MVSVCLLNSFSISGMDEHEAILFKFAKWIDYAKGTKFKGRGLGHLIVFGIKPPSACSLSFANTSTKARG